MLLTEYYYSTCLFNKEHLEIKYYFYFTFFKIASISVHNRFSHPVMVKNEKKNSMNLPFSY